jgi:hypothetical protein
MNFNDQGNIVKKDEGKENQISCTLNYDSPN